MALLAVLLTAVGVFVGWWFGRRQAQTSLSALPVSDDELAVVRAIYEFGPAKRIFRTVGGGSKGYPAFGDSAFDDALPENAFVAPAIQRLRDHRLIDQTEPSRLTEAGLQVMLANSKRKPARTIIFLT